MSTSTNFPLLKFLCFALVLQQTLGVGVPLAELFASCAFFAGDVYNETPLSVPSPLPGWKHASAYRFHLVETGYHDGYADGYTSDQGDYVLAVRGSYAVNPDYSYVKEKAGGLIPNPLSDSLDPHNLVQGMVWHKALRYAEAENMLQKPLDRKTLLTDAVLMCRRGLRVAITGHGYGGGIATFLAWKLHAEEPDCEVKVVTFGAPPIATEKAVKSFFDQLNLDMKRFVMQCFDGNKGTAWWDASIHSDPTATSTDPHVLVDFGPEASLQGRFQPLWKRAQRLATDTKHDQNEVAVRTCHEMSNYFDALQQELKAERGYALKWCAASVKEQAEIDGDDIVHVKPEGDADLLPPSLKKFIPPRALNEVSDFDEDDSRESKRTHATCLHTPSFDRDAEKPTRLKGANRKRK